MTPLEDSETIRGVLRVAAQHGIDTPGMGFVALRRIETALVAADRLVQDAAFVFMEHDPEDARPAAHSIACSVCGEAAPCDCTEGENDDSARWEGAMRRNYRRIVHDRASCDAWDLIVAMRGDPS